MGAFGQELAQSPFGERRGIWRCNADGVKAVFACGFAQRRLDPLQVAQKSRSA
jgi:hypothetical protein